MKKQYIILTSFFSLIIIFSLVFHLSFLSAEQKNLRKKTENEFLNTSIRTDVKNVTKITKNTKLTEEQYDMVSGAKSVKDQAMPEEYMGLTRDMLIHHLREYAKNLPDAERKKGLVSMDLVSFSEDEIVVKKIYNKDKDSTQYYMGVKNGFIVVYKNDNKTVFDETDIPVQGLSEVDKVQLENGIGVANLDELYGMLEGYSS